MSEFNEGTIRKATADDYDEIMSIYQDEEADYLPDYFHLLLRNPNTTAYVLIIKGQIVALKIAFIVDNGLTAVMRAGRIRKEFEHRHAYQTFAMEVLKRTFSKRGAFTTSLDSQGVYKHISSGEFQLLSTRKCLFYSGKKVSFSIAPERNFGLFAKVLNENELANFIKNQRSYPNVFRENRLVVDSVPYRLMEENVPLILMERTHAVGSCLDDSDKTLLTFGSYFRVLNGKMFCKLDIYGHVSETLADHVLLHIQQFWSRVEENFIIDCRYGEADSVDSIDKAMFHLGLTKIPKGTYSYSGLIACEGGMPSSKL